MAILFQVLRGFFYCFTVIMGILLVRGDLIIGEQAYSTLKEVVMPGYLVFCGIMMGYFIAVIWQGKTPASYDLSIQQSILNKSFIIGIVIGIILALCYVLL